MKNSQNKGHMKISESAVFISSWLNLLSYCSIGEVYFKLEKLKGWSGQQQQTLAGFEKIQTVGKGNTR